VHFHEPFPLATVAALLTERTRPFVITWHSDIVRQRAAKPLVEFLQRRACAKSALVTTTSERLARHSSVLASLTGSIAIIPLSIDPAFGEAPAPAPLVQEPYGLYFGRLASYKGLSTLVAALRRCDLGPLKFVIAGSGPEGASLRTRLQGLESRVVLIDRSLNDSEKKSLLAHCSFLVFPSASTNEAFGIVQLEAMAHGKPVINTDLPTGVPWVSLDEDTGLTVPTNDATALAAAMSRMASDEVLRDKMGGRAKMRVAQVFSDAVVLPQLRPLLGRTFSIGTTAGSMVLNANSSLPLASIIFLSSVSTRPYRDCLSSTCPVTLD
jgi:rhamnosyl/mannosyltransferase